MFRAPAVPVAVFELKVLALMELDPVLLIFIPAPAPALVLPVKVQSLTVSAPAVPAISTAPPLLLELLPEKVQAVSVNAPAVTRMAPPEKVEFVPPMEFPLVTVSLLSVKSAVTRKIRKSVAPDRVIVTPLVPPSIVNTLLMSSVAEATSPSSLRLES